MESKRVSNSNKSLVIISRGRWLFLGSLLLGITCGLLFYLAQDRLYKSAAILIDKRQVPPDQTTSSKQEGLGVVVSAVAPLVVSRSNLESIINEEGLYADLSEDFSLAVH